MKYIIDEEELKEHIFLKLTHWLKSSRQLDDMIINRGKCADDITESFLKSKTPVEEIAVHGVQGGSKLEDGKLYISQKDLMKNLRFNKIYIEVIK